MKRILYIFLILVSSLDTRALKTPEENLKSMLQIDFGLSGTNAKYGSFYGFSGAIRFPARTTCYLGFEGNYYQTNTKYTWPELGDYRYKRTLSCFSPMFGVNLFREYKLNLSYKLKYNIVNFDGKLNTSNPLLQEHLLNSYEGTHDGLSIGAELNYTISGNFSSYLDFGFFKVSKHTTYVYLSLGLSCKLINSTIE